MTKKHTVSLTDILGTRSKIETILASAATTNEMGRKMLTMRTIINSGETDYVVTVGSEVIQTSTGLVDAVRRYNSVD